MGKPVFTMMIMRAAAVALFSIVGFGVSVAATEVTVLDGSGTTNPSKFFWEVNSLFEARAKPPVRVTYRAVGSGAGQYEFIGADNGFLPISQDFGSGDIPITASDYQALKGAGHEIIHYPFQMGAMSIFHNVPGMPKSGAGALNLTACVLAKIFKREIKTWDHSEIKALNPSLNAPAGQDIKVYHRVQGSSTTGGVTTYLHAACPSVWTGELVGSTIQWPADTYEAYGSGEMSSKLSSIPYSIGYIDSGHGHADGLTEIALENKAGTYRTSLEAGATGIAAAATEAIAASVMPTSPLADFSTVSLHNMGGADTWPIVAISYVYLRKNLTSLGDRACLLKAFLEYIISDEGQALLPAYDAVGVPNEVKSIANTALNSLVMPACTAWSFEGSSTMAGTGQSDHVISLKRRDYAEYDRGQLKARTVEYKENAKIQALEATIAQLTQQLAELKQKESSHETTEDKGKDNNNALGVAAIAMATPALAVSVAAMLVTLRIMNMASAARAGGGAGAQMIGSPQVAGTPVSAGVPPLDDDTAKGSAQEI
eukprot:TRINITY_DN4909_c0_g1_i7.p1 TRINITY_DN4909_c0_g1~~TRINITY_DN4909_c0_g1_i7.p1  ORF type:complete len:541 (-),score=100.57 TRINITY_DN4909_c0_g1_i7:85-1707(-)